MTRPIYTSLCSTTLFGRKSRETVIPGKTEVLETKTRYSRYIYLEELENVLQTASWWMLLNAWTTSAFYYFWAVEELSSCHQFNLSSKTGGLAAGYAKSIDNACFHVTNEQSAIFACDWRLLYAMCGKRLMVKWSIYIWPAFFFYM